MDDSGRIKLALIFGGQSLEHEVSLMSARSVLAGLDAARFDVVLAGIDKSGGWHVYDCPRQRIDGRALGAAPGGALDEAPGDALDDAPRLDSPRLGGRGADGETTGCRSAGGESADGENTGGRSAGEENTRGENAGGGAARLVGAESADGENKGGKSAGEENTRGENAGDGAARLVGAESADGENTGAESAEYDAAGLVGAGSAVAVATAAYKIVAKTAGAVATPAAPATPVATAAPATPVATAAPVAPAVPATPQALAALAIGGIVLKERRPIGDMCGGATVQALAEEGVDVFFPVLHGRLGEDGSMQGLLEMAGAAYVGCGVFASAACMDKSMAKIILGAAGIPQARHIACRAGDLAAPAIDGLLDEIEAKLGFPCFVKPSSSGSSVGVSKCGSRQALLAALRGAAQFDDKILVEEFVDGREFECSVLGGDSPQTSVVGEIIPGAEFYDYDAKYVSETSRSAIPADLPDAVSARMRELAAAAFVAMGCDGLARVDFFVRAGSGDVVLNEINTMPGFTQISMYPKLWEASGLPLPQLIERLVELALERKRRDGRLVKTLGARPGGVGAAGAGE
ncbi:MAG: D-alanine--D-alanine ligase [Clostridiales bacterium]|jgi:D-alanine-D-alanine ligase|nr:D-alanine--D-alanine ligase [Clostridiales bacterium]